jgi:hypothetical protein
MKFNFHSKHFLSNQTDMQLICNEFQPALWTYL